MGQKFTFDLNPEEGNNERVQLPHPEIFNAAKKGDELLVDDNYKDILLRFCQNKFGTTPNYKITETSGPPHNRTFKISCYIQELEYKYGKGKNKKDDDGT